MSCTCSRHNSPSGRLCQHLVFLVSLERRSVERDVNQVLFLDRQEDVHVSMQRLPSKVCSFLDRVEYVPLVINAFHPGVFFGRVEDVTITVECLGTNSTFVVDFNGNLNGLHGRSFHRWNG